VDARPLFGEELLALSLQQHIARTRLDEHTQSPPLLDQFFVDQLLIALQNGERIDAKFGGHIAHGGQRIAVFEHAVENHVDDAIAELAIDRLTVVPLEIHPVFQEKPL
jgi:hypothetical protein